MEINTLSLIIVAVLVVTIIAVFAYRHAVRLRRSLADAQQRAQEIESTLQGAVTENLARGRRIDALSAELAEYELGLQRANADLARYRTIIDAEAEVARLLQSTRETVAQERAELIANRQQVEDEIERIRVQAMQLRERAQADASAMLERGRQEAMVQTEAIRSEARQIKAEAERIQVQAVQLRESAQADASALLEQSRQEAMAQTEAIRSEARQSRRDAQALRARLHEDARALQARTDAEVARATVQAQHLIDEAHVKATEIAGEALRIRDKADLYERTVTAMKNLIEGYGERYFVPTHTLLDDVADDFGHTQAGQELKTARALSAAMVRGGQAATCDYAESQRRKTAINFVIDAFNGKADGILARLRHDNAGKLEQELRDAFALVNFHGAAFRNARIQPTYLDARLAELRWGAMSYELQLREREEQRLIKERMREEEKARREYERAVRETAKEEEQLQRALARARQEIEQATGEQRAQYEAQLAELAKKLQLAEEKNQRAISMAQQTRAGHVYVISNIGSFGEGVLKIGMTRRLEPLDRVRELGDASVPFSFDVHALAYSEDAPTLERELHRRFNALRLNKVNFRKEFFRLEIAHVREAMTELGLTPHFTLTAEAREYRESIAVDHLPAEHRAAVLESLLELEETTDAIDTADAEERTA